jgi:hypothetical protein
MHHAKMIRMPVVSLSRCAAKRFGCEKVCVEGWQVLGFLEHQKLVIMPRTMDSKAMASSKQGKSSTGDGCWLTRRRQTSVIKGATMILYKGAIQVLQDEN